MTQEQPPASKTEGTADWSTPASRVKWLVERLNKGNRSAFAESIGVTHPTISKVVAGKPPGRKLLMLIAQHLRVNSGWLLTGGRGSEPLVPTSDSRRLV